jgi:predicted dinucleotide-binding enzyme
MQIAIIGTGNVGAALGRRRTRHSFRGTAARCREGHGRRQESRRARALAVREAAAGAAAVVLAVPFDAVEQAIAACGNLTGKIVVDCNYPLFPHLSGWTVGHTDSCGERVARWAKGASVVKMLNTTGSGNMLDPRYRHEALSMFVCGDDADAKKVVAELGFEPVDAGPLTRPATSSPWRGSGSAWPMGLGRVQISGSACCDGKLHQPPSHTACVQ